MLAATFFTLQAPEPDHERFSELRCSKVTLGEPPDEGPSYYLSATFNAQTHLSMRRFCIGPTGKMGTAG